MASRRTNGETVVPKMACWNAANCPGWPKCRLAHVDQKKNKPPPNAPKYNTRGSIIAERECTKRYETTPKRRDEQRSMTILDSDDDDDSDSDDDLTQTEVYLTPVSTKKLKDCTQRGKAGLSADGSHLMNGLL